MIKMIISSKTLSRFCGYLLATLFFIHLMSTGAMASDSGWRPIYDEVMLWINFFILVFIIVKYGKKPFMDFLRGRSDEVENSIQELQKQKNAIDAKIHKTNQMIEDSSIKFEQIKTRIINEGERAKQKIIEDAKTQSEKIIELEKLKAQNRIVQARNDFMAELVDAASTLAQKRLPAEITNQDHQQLLNLFLSNITHTSEQTA
jgi:F-type H+-transporting ATPase subunit b